MSMKKIVSVKTVRNLMTLATEFKYNFFPNTIFYMGYYCLFSVAEVIEENPFLNLNKGQIIITSPMIGDAISNNNCTIYKTIEVDAELGLLIPIVSFALEFSKHIISLESPVYLKKYGGVIETLLMQILKYENVNLSEEGIIIDLLNLAIGGVLTKEKIYWEDHDSLMHAENLIRSNLIDFTDFLLPHAHTENINYFKKASISKDVIFDW